MVTVLLVSLAVSMFLTVPIAVSIAISAIAGFLVFYPDTPMFNMLAQATVTAADSFPLMAVPFFMLVGTLMGKSGIAESLVNVAEALSGRLAGGLAMAGIVASMFFAAISGSGPAVVAAIGAILIPSMVKRNYDADYSGAVLASASTIGVVIPPSIPLIMYGVTAGVSVSSLFIAGIIPGLLMGVALLIVNYFISKRRGYIGLSTEGGLKYILLEFWKAKWALLMPVIVLGGIYAGIFTPTESAVVGVLYALLIGTMVTKNLTWTAIKESLIEAALLSATIMFLIGGALTFGRLLTMERIPEMLAEQMMSLTSSPFIILMLIMVFLLITGMFIDTVSNIILFTPIFLPVIVQLGYDPVFFGVLMTVNLAIGFLTPPLGMSLFVAQGVAKVSFESIVKQIWPLLLVLLVVLVLLAIFPGITTFLPNVFQ